MIYRTARLADDVDDELAVEPRDEARCCRWLVVPLAGLDPSNPSWTEATGTDCRDDERDDWETELRVELERTLDGALPTLDRSSICV